MNAWCIVVAAGRSERFGGSVPKLLVPHGGRPLIARTLERIDACPAVDGVVLVASAALEQGWRAAGSPGRKVRAVVPGGETRQESVANGLAAIPAGAEVVLVHDGARPFATEALFTAVRDAAARSGCALPVLEVRDTVKRVVGDRVIGTVPRDEIRLAQTPQGFRHEVLRAAHDAARSGAEAATDDVALVERAMAAGLLAGVSVEAVPGEESNVKVTRPVDLPAASTPRVGLGHDVHPLQPGRAFVLAGVDLQPGAAEHERFGPVGHSDGDALVHAVCDAILGAVGLGDIGQWFPDTSPENAGRPSLEFLATIVERLAAEGWRVASVSAVIQLERPRLAPHSAAIRQALAEALRIPADAVGLSAKRGEGLGPVGEGRAVACDCVVVVGRA